MKHAIRLPMCTLLASACTAAQDVKRVRAHTVAALPREAADRPCAMDAECRTAPAGARDCGGPESYLAWSVRAQNADAWLRAVAAYSDARRTSLRDGGAAMSICSMAPDPGARCVQGLCMLGTADAIRWRAEP